MVVVLATVPLLIQRVVQDVPFLEISYQRLIHLLRELVLYTQPELQALVITQLPLIRSVLGLTCPNP